MVKKLAYISGVVLNLAVALALVLAPFSAAILSGTAKTNNVFAFAADDYSTVVIDKTLWSATTEENEAILQQASEANLVGYNALKLYLSGEVVDAAAFKTIDTNVLATINSNLATVITNEQNRITQAQEAAAQAAANSSQQNASVNSSVQQQDQANNSTTSQPQTTNTDATNSAQATEQNIVVEDAPDDVQQTTETVTPDEETGSISVSANPTTEEFIASIGEDARQLCQEADLYASVMIAQAVIESASGSSGLAKEPYYNLFGIKGSYNGSSVRMKTQEDDGSGNYSTITAEFRKYPSKKESLQDYVSLLTNNSLYEPAKKSKTSSYIDTCDYLQGRYATSSTYSKTLQAYVQAYNLTEYDSPKSNKSEDAAKASEADSSTKASADGKSPTYTSYAYGSPDDVDLPETAGEQDDTAAIVQLIVGIALLILLFSAAFYMYWLRKTGKIDPIQKKLAYACSNATTNIKNIGNKLNGLEAEKKPNANALEQAAKEGKQKAEVETTHHSGLHAAVQASGSNESNDVSASSPLATPSSSSTEQTGKHAKIADSATETKQAKHAK